MSRVESLVGREASTATSALHPTNQHTAQEQVVASLPLSLPIPAALLGASVLRLGNISGNFWKFSEIFPKISKGLEKLENFGFFFYSKAR